VKPIRFLASFAIVSLPLAMAGCISGPSGVEGTNDVADIPIQGTIFTIVFENEDANVVEEMPYLQGLAKQYASASAYYADHHPSLPNYLQLISGTDQGVTDDEAPAAHQFDSDNLTKQLDAAKIPWRAYMEDMVEPCHMENNGEYAVRHDPFVYFTSVTSDSAYCGDHVVDMAAHLDDDLKADQYRYMWITPNTCNDIHDCEPSIGDRWLSKIIPQIMESDGYKNGGAIFILWDEGGQDASYLLGGKQNIAAVVISDDLVSPGFVSDVLYSHDSYLATVQDAFGLPRLPSTLDSTPMADFFDTTIDSVPVAPRGMNVAD
jgi:phosphatidylinositol-3-phosphatase